MDVSQRVISCITDVSPPTTGPLQKVAVRFRVLLDRAGISTKAFVRGARPDIVAAHSNAVSTVEMMISFS